MRILPTTLSHSLLLALPVALSACDPSGPLDSMEGPDRGAPTLPDASTGLPRFQSCLDGAIPEDLPTVRWTHFGNWVLTLTLPWHSAQDTIAIAGATTTIPGKFSYGATSKDLEGERIEVWIDDCAGGYRLLGERVSDSDGRIGLALSHAEMPEIGEYGLYLRVMGDNSAARSVLRIYPAGTRFVVFDIDATLTTSDTELVGQVISEILDGDFVPLARDGAQEITVLRHAEHNYELLYVTGRPYLLTQISRDWLRDLQFPGGTLRVTDEVGASWPSDSAVGTYKADYLHSLIAQGFTIDIAYGNATTDIYAYEQAGIAKDRTYILGENGGMSSTIALGETYTDHIPAIRPEPAATQPFQR